MTIDNNTKIEIVKDGENIRLTKEGFLIDLIRNLSGTLEEVAGLEEASGMVSLVGGLIGNDINNQYRAHFGVDFMNVDQIGRVLVDLKRRIDGGFTLESVTDDELVLVNTACPFGKAVIGRKSMCMMTSNVFGKIAAENLGYARVELNKTIADGDPGCRVIVHLKPAENLDEIDGREYFGEKAYSGL